MDFGGKHMLRGAYAGYWCATIVMCLSTGGRYGMYDVVYGKPWITTKYGLEVVLGCSVAQPDVGTDTRLQGMLHGEMPAGRP